MNKKATKKVKVEKNINELEKKKNIKQKIDMIAKESFNAEQKHIAKQIIDNTKEEDLDAVWGLINQRVKTGFVFDEAPEVNHNCVAYIKENTKLGINLDKKDVLEHALIIGENYDALKNLLVVYTDRQGKGLVDVIYIDPPYNTEKTKEEGNDYKDDVEASKFIYRDKYTRDGWLNMMNERLKLAKKLLSDDGVIFISIDDNEQAYLTILCNEIFGEENFIANAFVLDNLKGKTNDKFITSVGSRLVVYAKNKQSRMEIGFNEIENIYGDTVENTYKLSDEIGLYKLITFKKTGQSKYREDRPFMFYPILEKNNVLYSIKEDEFDKIYNKKTEKFDDSYLKKLKQIYKDYNFILPTSEKNEYLRWTSGFASFNKKMNDDIIYNNGQVMQKNRPSPTEMLQEYASGTPKNFIYKPNYSNGTDDLDRIITNSGFDFPKSVSLLKDIIKLFPSNDINILDFYAGSGTTGQAVMELNEEDEGTRKFILVTNNENDIAKKITRERLYRVINGKGSKNEKIKWEYSTTKKSLSNNSVRVFDIEKCSLNITETKKAEKIKKEAETNFDKLDKNYKKKDVDIYYELSCLTPQKEDK